MPTTVQVHFVDRIESTLEEFPAGVNTRPFVTVTITAFDSENEELTKLVMYGKDKESMQIYGWSAK